MYLRLHPLSNAHAHGLLCPFFTGLLIFRYTGFGTLYHSSVTVDRMSIAYWLTAKVKYAQEKCGKDY